MTGKLALAVGFAAGYVLGSKAGRERYEQLVAAGQQFWTNPTVQSTAGVLQAQANDLVTKAKNTVRHDKTDKTIAPSTGMDTATVTEVYEPATGGTYVSDRPGPNTVTP
jgi:hypothetical protein